VDGARPSGSLGARARTGGFAKSCSSGSRDGIALLMAFPRMVFRPLGALLLAASTGACSQDARTKPPRRAADSIGATASLRASLRSGHYAVCDSVGALWKQMAGVTVTQVDTIISPQSAGPPTSACRVALVAPGGLPEGAVTRVHWADSTLRGWSMVTEAEGPDGFHRIFVRSGLRCQIDFTQDGGDDSDSTYVPGPAVAERTICWADPAGVTARDTGTVHYELPK
jgi:hypothetical protein